MQDDGRAKESVQVVDTTRLLLRSVKTPINPAGETETETESEPE